MFPLKLRGGSACPRQAEPSHLSKPCGEAAQACPPMPLAIAQNGLIDQIAALDATLRPEFVSLPVFPDCQIQIHAVLIDQEPTASLACVQGARSGDRPNGKNGFRRPRNAGSSRYGAHCTLQMEVCSIRPCIDVIPRESFRQR
jgi:hypothetical protein